MRIPEPIRLWWYDGGGVRVLRYSGRQWTVLAVVSFVCSAASLLPTNSLMGRAVLFVVPYMLVPAGITATVCAIIAAVLTHQYRTTYRC